MEGKQCHKKKSISITDFSKRPRSENRLNEQCSGVLLLNQSLSTEVWHLASQRVGVCGGAINWGTGKKIKSDKGRH